MALPYYAYVRKNSIQATSIGRERKWNGNNPEYIFRCGIIIEHMRTLLYRKDRCKQILKHALIARRSILFRGKGLANQTLNWRQMHHPRHSLQFYHQRNYLYGIKWDIYECREMLLHIIDFFLKQHNFLTVVSMTSNKSQVFFLSKEMGLELGLY